MPLLVHAVVWWLAGLFIGTRSPSAAPYAAPAGPDLRPLALAGLLGLLVWWRSRRPEARREMDARWLAPLFACAAWVLGEAAMHERARCRAQLQSREPGASSLAVLVEQAPRSVSHTRTDARLRGTAYWTRHEGHPCAGSVLLSPVREPGPTPRVGMWLLVQGQLQVTDRGLRMEQARWQLSGPTPQHGGTAWQRALVTWRAHLGHVIDERFRSRAPLVRALLIADQQQIAPEIREQYADAGLVHMLSVSGMHVAIIASALLTLGSLLRLPRPWLEPAAMLVVAGYVALLGFPAPAVRSAVMLVVIALSKRLQRPVHEWTALALGAAVPTLDPFVVTDLGYQLSVSGMAALVAARALLRRWRRASRAPRRTDPSPPPPHVAERLHELVRWLGRQQGIGGWLVSEIATGVVATLVTAPVIAWTFGRLSVIAPLANVAAGPVIGVLQPALFLALAWALLVPGEAGTLIPDATQPLMALFDAVASVFSAFPGGVWPLAPTLATAVGTGVAAALLVRGTASRRLTPWLLASAAVLVATLWLPLTRRGSGKLEMHVLDVGQGDAVALRTPHGRWVLVDAGPRWPGGDAGQRTVVPYIRRLGGDVALFVMSHPHEDHVGGAASVIRALGVPRWWEAAFVGSSPGYRHALRALQRHGGVWERVRPGTRWQLDGVTLTVLAPDSSWTAAQHDANETSVVLRVEYGAHRMLLTGDAERHEEGWLVERHGADALAADVLKAGHHGSRTSSTPAFLDRVAPAIAIASLGTGNRYGHPAVETLEAFADRGIPLLRTDHDGTLVVRSDGQRLEVESHGERWPVRRPAHGPGEARP